MTSTRLKMRDRLDQAIRLALEINPEAKLVRISGLGVHADGAVELGRPNDYISRWEYAFMDDREGEAPPFFVSVLYYASGEPLVTPNPGNVTQSETFDEEIIPELQDSDALVEIFNDQPDYKPMGGYQQDALVYSMRRALDPIVIMQNWKGQFLRLDPISLDII